MYFFFKFLTSFYLKLYYRKVYFSNGHKIPKDKPLIFASNHPTAFIEPIALRGFSKVDSYFLVRGDFFKKPIFRRLLESINLIPIFRYRDEGLEGVKKNNDSFELTSRHLAKNRNITILAEGSAEHEKRMRPILKGCARIALKAIDANPGLDVYIVPVGVNFADAEFERTDVMFQINNPIRVQDYLSTDDNDNKRVVEITKELSKRMKAKIIHINDPKDDQMTEAVLDVVRSTIEIDIYPPVSTSSKRFLLEYKTVESINDLESNKKDLLKSDVGKYSEDLKRFNITDREVYSDTKNSILKSIVLIIGAIPAVLGFVINFLPIYVGKYIANNKIKRTVFKSPIVFAVSMFMYLIIYGILLITSLVKMSLGLFLFTVVCFFLGHFYLLYKEYFVLFKRRRHYSKLNKENTRNLKTQRENILAFLK